MAEAFSPKVQPGVTSASLAAAPSTLATLAGLSAEARLTLIYLLSTPAGSDRQVDDVRALLGRAPAMPAGRNRAYAVMRELKAARYLVDCYEREGGRFVGVTYLAFAEPRDPEAVRAAHSAGRRLN